MSRISKAIVNYIFGNRYYQFISKLCKFAKTARSFDEKDDGPNNIFTGTFGDVITKNKEQIFYKTVNNKSFVSLSSNYSELTEQTKYVLSDGINKHASWIKTNESECSWKLLGYYTGVYDKNCCYNNPALENIVSGSKNILSGSENIVSGAIS